MLSDAERLIELESRVAFQDRTLNQLDEQLRWAVNRVQDLERTVSRVRNQMAEAGPRTPVQGVGYAREEGSASPSAPEGHPQ